MKKENFQFLTLSIFLLLFFNISTAKAQAEIDIESGLVFTGYNDVRIPGNAGTLFSLKNDLKPETEPFLRVRLNYTMNDRHTISILYAPLTTKYSGSVNKEILFRDVVFPAQTEIEGEYKFNSYRLTYRYDIVKKPRIEFGLGFTAKIRDARIALSSPALNAEKINTGFVPIINFRLFWDLDNKFGILLEGDALAAPQGRAEDILLAVTYTLSDKFKTRAGYRILEGGADNDEVYTFSLFHYAAIGLSYTFGNRE